MRPVKIDLEDRVTTSTKLSDLVPEVGSEDAGSPNDTASENEASDLENDIPEPEGDTEIIETDYTIGQDNISKQWTLEFDFHHIVFTISALSIVGFTFFALALQNEIEPFFLSIRAFITSRLDWFFLASGNVFLLLCLGLIVSPLGKVRLGGPDSTPDYSYMGWFAMLFAAGMGVGMIFFGVTEPMAHFSTALAGTHVDANGIRTDWAPLSGAIGDITTAQRLGLAATIFHWGLHPWAIYAVAALSLALFSFNKGLPLTLRSVFYPVLGERVWGWPGHIIDILAVFSTMFGLACALGVGAQQISAGLDFLLATGTSNTLLVVVVMVITGVALVSVINGLDSGVRKLSEISLMLGLAFMTFVIIAGPTWEIATSFFRNLSAYGEYLIDLSTPFERDDKNFVTEWTAPYWAWWISWSPFVGMFIARISRGRTVREFLMAVLIIPTLLSTLWMTALGETAIVQMIVGNFTGVQDAALELKLFKMLSQLPLTEITSAVGIMLIVLFFVTSLDSGSLVIDTISAGGKVNAPTIQRVFWTIFGGLVAIALSIGKGLTAPQAMVLCAGLPFTFVLLAACYSIILGLINEYRVTVGNSDTDSVSE